MRDAAYTASKPCVNTVCLHVQYQAGSWEQAEEHGRRLAELAAKVLGGVDGFAVVDFHADEPAFLDSL